MNKIKRISYILYLFFKIFCWIVPAMTTYLIFFHLEMLIQWGAWDNIILLAHNEIHPASPFSLLQRTLILFIQFIPLSIIVLIWNKLSKLFHLYEKETLFELENIQLIKSVGVLMLLGQTIQLIYQPLMSYALTFNNPVGERVISLTVGKTNATAILTGFILLIASWIVKEAHQLKSDVQLTI